MSYSFSRDRTDEIREGGGRRGSDSDEFRPNRQPAGYRSSPTRGNNPFDRPSRQPPVTRYEESDKLSESYEMEPLRDLNSQGGFLDGCAQLKEEIARVNANITDIEDIHERALVSNNDDQWAELSRDINRLKGIVRDQNQGIKKQLKAMDDNVRVENDRKLRGIKDTQSKVVKTSFIKTIQRYQDVERTYQTKYRKRVERQIRIVKPEATEAEVDAFIDSEEPQQIFSQNLIQAGRRAQTRTVLSEVENRHQDIKKIQKTIVELHELFTEMQMMVQQQGEVLTQIEDHTQDTSHNLEQGNKSVTRAILFARATRAKKWCCFVIVIILCVVIAILVWWFGFNHKGVGDNQ